MSIYVVESQPLQMSDMDRYRYQVLSEDSDFYQLTDWIFSKCQMSDGHSYDVRVNTNQKIPEVIEIFQELDDKNLGV